MAFGVRGNGARTRVAIATDRPAPGVYQALTRLWNLAALNVLWLIACVPVVTIPLATGAAFGAIDRWSRCGDDRVARSFLEILRNLAVRLTIGAGVPFGVAAVGGIEVAYFAHRSGVINQACFGFGLGFATASALSLGYVLLLLVGQPALPIGEVWKAAGRLAIGNLALTGPLFAAEFIGAAIIAFIEPALVVLVVPVVLLFLLHKTARFGFLRATTRERTNPMSGG